MLIAIYGPDRRNNILVLGPTGSGKEGVAEALDESAGGKEKRRLYLNCADFGGDENIAHHTIFGSEKGAHAGAAKAAIKGAVDKYDTLILDEFGALPEAIQTRLLRFLQSGVFRRVGGTEELHADCRVIALTNEDVVGRAADGTFRDDLLYRFAVTIELPPLGERREDVPLLAVAALRRWCEERGTERAWPWAYFEAEALEELATRDWPGNVRELMHEVGAAVTWARDPWGGDGPAVGGTGGTPGGTHLGVEVVDGCDRVEHEVEQVEHGGVPPDGDGWMTPAEWARARGAARSTTWRWCQREHAAGRLEKDEQGRYRPAQ